MILLRFEDKAAPPHVQGSREHCSGRGRAQHLRGRRNSWHRLCGRVR